MKQAHKVRQPYVVDFDDYCDNVMPELEVLDELKKTYPAFQVTLFAIPMRCSEAAIEAVRQRNALETWLHLAPHGWRHTRGECLSWDKNEAIDKISIARELGIDMPVFKAPAWLLDEETYEACGELQYAIAAHRKYRILDTATREYIYNGDLYHWNWFEGIHGHLTPVSGNYIRDMHADGRLKFDATRKFSTPTIVAEVIKEVKDAHIDA